MMPYSFIVVNILLQYHRNNRIDSCCNYRRELFQYRSTLTDTQLIFNFLRNSLTTNILVRSTDTKLYAV